MRRPVYFDNDVHERLKDYCRNRYGSRRTISAVVQHAVVLFLDSEEFKATAKAKRANKKKEGIID